MESLLSGEGTGYSVQKVHTEQLPVMKGVDPSKKLCLKYLILLKDGHDQLVC